MGTPRVVIIGAGIVGANLADEFTQRGWDRVTVLDQGPIPLTGGSTSHAPGLAFQTNPSRAMTELASYTVYKLATLVRDGQPAFNPVGGLEVATTPERLAELHRRCDFATAWGLHASVLGPEVAARRHPLLDPDRILGALYVPSDGLASSLMAVEALRARAESRGARFLERTPVTAIDSDAGRVTGVRSSETRFAADVVICAAGFWGPAVGELAGVNVPLRPLAHQYVTTSELPELAGFVPTPGVSGAVVGTGNTAVLPMLRHQDQDLYFRQVGNRIGIGSYAHRPLPARYEDLPGDERVDHEHMPSRLPFTPQDFTGSWEQSRALLPALNQARVESGFNGIFSFTPDGGSLVGESAELRGFVLAEAVWVTHSAGVARALAELLVDGHSTTDLRELDVARFEQVQLAPDYVRETSEQAFVEVYDIKHPLEPRRSPRNLRSAPFHGRQVELGAVFLEAGGWERPHWFEANRPLLQELPEAWIPPERDAWTGRFDSPVSAAEAYATRTRAGLYDLTPLRRLELSGPGVVPLLETLTTSVMDRAVGSVAYTLMLDNAGGIRSDLTVARVAPELFQVGANGGIDAAHLTRQFQDWNTDPANPPATLKDITDRTCCIGVWGPAARELVQPLTAQDLSSETLPYFRMTQARVAGIAVLMLRVSYVGELGWEIYADAVDGLALWDALWDAGRSVGAVAAGRAAFTGLRIEKGYRAWGTDLDTGRDPFQSGLGFAVDPAKNGYIGHDAVERLRVRGLDGRPRLRSLTVDDATTVVMGSEPVLIGTRTVGYTTSAAYGYTVHRPVAYAWLDGQVCVGDPVVIRAFDRMVPATVVDTPIMGQDRTALRG